MQCFCEPETDACSFRKDNHRLYPLQDFVKITAIKLGQSQTVPIVMICAWYRIYFLMQPKFAESKVVLLSTFELVDIGLQCAEIKYEQKKSDHRQHNLASCTAKSSQLYFISKLS